MIEITRMKWRYVHAYDFYQVNMELDGYAKICVYINSHRLNGVDLDLPDAVAHLLRAKLSCTPERGVEKIDSSRGTR